MISYVRTYAKSGNPSGQFSAFGNNLGNITLDFNYAGPTQFMIQGVYTCVNLTTVSQKKSMPVALFQTLDAYIDFMIAILTPNKERAQVGMLKYYICYFPQSNISEEYFETFSDYYNREFGPVLEQAEKSAQSVGIKTTLSIFESPVPSNPNSLNTQTPASPVCPLTLITSFSPTSGKEGDIITLEGDALQFVKTITVAGSLVDKRTLQFINTKKIKFSVPPRVGALPVSGPIQITSSSTPNPINSTTNFTYTA